MPGFTQLESFDCLTPLGPACCLGFWIDGDVTEWLCDIKATREPWWFRNEDFRFGQTVTNGSKAPSPFGEPNAKLARQIERYWANGWLPSGELRLADLLIRRDPVSAGSVMIATGTTLDLCAADFGITRKSAAEYNGIHPEPDSVLRQRLLSEIRGATPTKADFDRACVPCPRITPEMANAGVEALIAGRDPDGPLPSDQLCAAIFHTMWQVMK